MTDEEIAKRIIRMMIDVVTIRFAGDKPRRLKVADAMEKIARFMKTEFRNSSESLDALEIMGEILKEIRREVNERAGRD